MSKRILLADDEEILIEAVSEILRYNNYGVDVVYDGKQAVEKVLENKYDIIILDVMMPVMSGIEAIKIIRKNNVNTPIILVTAKSEIDDKVEGLDAGANDYITKPFSQKELLARIRALTREKTEKKKYEIGNLIFDIENYKISTEKAALFLNNQESQIIKVFLDNTEKIYTKEELKTIINVKEDVIPMYITFLQEKFEALGANIKIENNNGYKINNI